MVVARSLQMQETRSTQPYLQVMLALSVKQDVLTRISAELGLHGL
jgi:hypothetical protein